MKAIQYIQGDRRATIQYTPMHGYVCTLYYCGAHYYQKRFDCQSMAKEYARGYVKG